MKSVKSIYLRLLAALFVSLCLVTGCFGQNPSAQDNREQIGRLKRNLTHALRQDITPRQREYMMLYYGQNLSMEAIAQKLGVNKSTVSRTLKRGRQRLYRCLRYGAANLLEQAEC